MSFIEIPDHVVDSKAYIAKLVQMFAEYPDAVMEKAAHIIPERSSKPKIDLVREVLNDLYEPILRDEERLGAQEQARLCLPPPDPVLTPEQKERRAKLAAEARKALGISEEGLPPKRVQPPPMPSDPDYSRRIAADLTRRRAINERRAAAKEDPAP